MPILAKNFTCVLQFFEASRLLLECACVLPAEWTNEEKKFEWASLQSAPRPAHSTFGNSSAATKWRIPRGQFFWANFFPSIFWKGFAFICDFKSTHHVDSLIGHLRCVLCERYYSKFPPPPFIDGFLLVGSGSDSSIFCLARWLDLSMGAWRVQPLIRGLGRDFGEKFFLGNQTWIKLSSIWIWLEKNDV